MTTYARVLERPLHEYDDMAFALRCLEQGLARELRVRAGVTQVELAKRVGTFQPIIVRWEGGGKKQYHGRPSLTDLDKLARYGRALREMAEQTGFVSS